MVLGINKHIKSLNEMTSNERFNVIETLNKTIEVIKKSDIAKEVLLIQEEKASHFHIWIVPIHDWMDKFGRNVRNIKEIINYAKHNFDEEQKVELLQAIEKIKTGFKEIDSK